MEARRLPSVMAMVMTVMHCSVRRNNRTNQNDQRDSGKKNCAHFDKYPLLIRQSSTYGLPVDAAYRDFRLRARNVFLISQMFRL